MMYCKILKFLSHLNEGGSIGAILPWSFIQADYAKPLRSLLKKQFRDIKVLALKSTYFDDAQERIIVLWMREYGKKTKSIKFALAKDVESEIFYKNLKMNEWESNRVNSITQGDLHSMFVHLQNEIGFTRFEQHAYARIGVVTGANKYFIRDKNDAHELGFVEENLIPIITTAKEFTEVLLNGSSNLKRLILIDEKQRNKFADYISKGEGLRINERSHCVQRDVWYSINPGKYPDAFFPYRVSRIPYMILNDRLIQSTNSVHRIYFHKMTDIEKKWIFVSLLSIYSQLSLIVSAKTYGRGMLKIEPGSLKDVLVVRSKEPNILEQYDFIISMLREGKKTDAVLAATAFLDKAFKIPIIISHTAIAVWNELDTSKRI